VINSILYTLTTIFSTTIIKKTDGEIKEVRSRLAMCGWQEIWGRGKQKKKGLIMKAAILGKKRFERIL
jgi:hypothetical protein